MIINYVKDLSYEIEYIYLTEDNHYLLEYIVTIPEYTILKKCAFIIFLIENWYFSIKYLKI